MAREFLTDEQVEQEISRLRSSEAVKLARKEISIKYRRRQQMYQLRNLEKRGVELIESGVNMDNIEEVLFGEAIDLEV
jgi:hypothetical protein